MKLNQPRTLLTTGLLLALSSVAALPAFAAGNTSKGKSLRIAQGQSDIVQPRTVSPSPGLPALSTTPGAPTPDPANPPLPSLDNLNVDPQPAKSTLPPVTTAPMPLGSKPNLAPTPALDPNATPRPPLGLFYGEQEKLDAYKDPVPRRLPPGHSLTPPPFVTDSVPVDPSQPHSGTDRFGVAPPPGTLGQTYKRRSRLIEDTKHPRVGVVEINLPEEVDVSALGLKTKWTGKVWRLESDPLLPGVPHIYEVKASWGEGTQPQIRTIRLIAGRIVDLEF